MSSNKQRVVVTGLGTYNPLGNDPDTLWQKISTAQSGIGPITHFDASEYKTSIAGEVKDFDPVGLFGRKEARRMSRVTQFAMAATNQALDDANLLSNGLKRDDVGVIIGCGMGSMEPLIDATNTLNERGPNRVSPFFVPMMLIDTPAATIAIAHGFRGPNMAIATACATGNNCLGEAMRMIQRGDVEVMVAGGSEACILPVAIAGFAIMSAMSTKNEAPTTTPSPFDLNRDGFVVSEGAAVFILESLEHAQKRNAKIYGELLGYGSSSDAYHISVPDQDGSGIALSMQRAINDAGIAPQQVQYVNAHGTGTQLNDAGETAAIKLVLGERAYDTPVSSTKSMHGHLFGATGVLEAMICLQGMNNSLLPPTINYKTADPDCDLDYVPNNPRPAEYDISMNNGVGLGGHNSTLILGKYA